MCLSSLEVNRLKLCIYATETTRDQYMRVCIPCFLRKSFISLSKKVFRSGSNFLFMHRYSKKMYRNIVLHEEKYLVKSRYKAGDR